MWFRVQFGASQYRGDMGKLEEVQRRDLSMVKAGALAPVEKLKDQAWFRQFQGRPAADP